MYHGTVKWFNNAKGYGFIVSDSFNEDLFTHYSSINIEGYKTLKAGQSVTFDITPGKNGLHAVDINTIPASEQAATNSSLANDINMDNLQQQATSQVESSVTSSVQ
ncbi:cold-shock protein [Marinomonas agarivorans]|nr:cold-shock protein [Marinomonas agarivorans]